MMPSPSDVPRYQLTDLLRVMARLREPDSGCPWDLRQDFQSIVSSTLEECYELAEAIEREDYPHVAEELGDVLFQVVFYAQLGAEQKLFSFATVVDTLTSKLIRRHPHVFAGGQIEGLVKAPSTVESVKQSWEAIKLEERKGKSLESVLADVPLALPALPRAQKLQKRAAQVDFDWTDKQAVLAKLEEEVAELREAISKGTAAEVEDELGDVLFTCGNVARHLGLDAESALRRANRKFEIRFEHMETIAAGEGRRLADLTQEELEQLWHVAKGKSGSQT